MLAAQTQLPELNPRIPRWKKRACLPDIVLWPAHTHTHYTHTITSKGTLIYTSILTYTVSVYSTEGNFVKLPSTFYLIHETSSLLLLLGLGGWFVPLFFAFASAKPVAQQASRMFSFRCLPFPRLSLGL